ncbi:V8-like Glu-specific endopeptidase [Rhizobium sp. BIGb0125]|uniref:S1 family peptidase n=1 Tax=Rhizobium sp. BIGb0125 TaxID=2940618 RepID=UPI002168EB40|nr:serine protease [Rhizobium sp. BIGb0125]MCS4242536.1 V8-like Glu-specific endopeptidase [Rhizobium sp. BIGb0125]
MFLQSFVTPIFTYRMNSTGQPTALNLMGTGFFVGKGVLLTAAHVLQNATAEVEAGTASGICANPKVCDPEGAGQDRFIEIKDYDVAEQPYDIAVALTDYSTQPNRLLRKMTVEIADDVSTVGYPESAFQKHDGTLYVQARVHRGYVQRVIPANRLFVGQSSPPMFELDFPITKGMSGSPLLFNTGKKELVVGVCVGSVTSRLIDYSETYVNEAGKEYSEVQQKVQEYGLAHDLTPLLDWRPKVLNGLTLGEAGI